MLKTLHLFLARELAKVTLMSLIAFTLVMTVFAIIEPLRKQGLSSDQMISFLGYTLPMMVSLTLPVAALFAATIVYGRLSQDNEVLACRAGGIATLALLEPALVLGVLVTAASLWLSNSVTPYLAEKAQASVRGNVKSIVQYQLRRQGYVRFQGNILHADSVEATPDGLRLHGMVLISTKPPKSGEDLLAPAPAASSQDANRRKAGNPGARSAWDVTVVLADTVTATFPRTGQDPFVGLHMEHPVVSRSSQFSFYQEEEAPIDSMPIPSSVKEDPAWYTWDELVQTMRDPARNANIQQNLRGLCTDLGHEMLVAEVISAIEANQAYAKLRGKWGRLEIRSPRAQRRPLEADLLATADANGRRIPVVVRIIGPRDVRVLEADRCRVTASRSPLKEISLASLDLDGDVRVRTEPLGAAASGPAATSAPAEGESDWVRRASVHVGDLEIPPDIAKSMARIDPNEVLANVKDISTDPKILGRAKEIGDTSIVRLRGRILAEMHGRLAYGLSCFLMVAMGAGLGLVYRGGQLLSAFVLSVVPAAVVIIMIVMGKQMLGSPKVPQTYGLAAVWGGIVALLLGNLGLYGHLARK